MQISRPMTRCKQAGRLIHRDNIDVYMLFILKTNDPDGFTMLEILVVMGIIAVVAALIVPRLGGTIYNLRLRSAVRKTSAVLRYMRSVAITTQKEQRASFILKEDSEEKDYYKYHKVTRKSSDQREGKFYEEDEVVLQDSPEELKQEVRKVELDAETLEFLFFEFVQA